MRARKREEEGRSESESREAYAVYDRTRRRDLLDDVVRLRGPSHPAVRPDPSDSFIVLSVTAVLGLLVFPLF